MSRNRLMILSSIGATALAVGWTVAPASRAQAPTPAPPPPSQSGAAQGSEPQVRAEAAAQAGPPAQPYASVPPVRHVPEFTADGRFVRPPGWRDWPYMGTPLTPNRLNAPEAPFPEFHNVYMDPESWDHFKRTGEYRDGIVLIKELVLVQTNGTTSPATGATSEASGVGYFMGEYAGLEAELKDSRRFPDAPGNWAYVTFGHVTEAQYATAKAPEAVETCNACHAANAQRDFVFIQHYPAMRGALRNR